MKPTSLLAVLISGILFGFGLSWSTMVKPEVVLSFLRLIDFGLLLVMAWAVCVTLMTYQLAPRVIRKPLLEPAFDQQTTRLNRRTLIGAAIFGIGWGIAGVCPGPAIAGLGIGNWPMLISLAGIFAGAYVQGRFTR